MPVNVDLKFNLRTRTDRWRSNRVTGTLLVVGELLAILISVILSIRRVIAA
ncbi:MAG: hypothetical protein ABJC10_11615 [Acidobacteriota bacterium]